MGTYCFSVPMIARRSTATDASRRGRCRPQAVDPAVREAAELHERRLRVVPREDGVDVRRTLERQRLPGHERDRPAFPVAVHPRRRERVADQVAVGDVGKVDAARGGEAVPLPEARVDLHQLVAAVARVALRLHLRDPVKAERAQEGEPLLYDLVNPDRLADARAAHEAARLAQLVAREEAERLAAGAHVTAERVQLLVAAGDQLLHHRLERRGRFVRALELGGALAPEELAPVPAPEAGVR